MGRSRQLVLLTLIALVGVVAIRPGDLVPTAWHFVTPLFAQQSSANSPPSSGFSFGIPASLIEAARSKASPAQSTAPGAARTTVQPAVSAAAPDTDGQESAPSVDTEDSLAHAPVLPSAMLTETAPQTPSTAPVAISPQLPTQQTTAAVSDPNEPVAAHGGASVITKIEPIVSGVGSGTATLEPEAKPARPIIPAKSLFGAAKVAADLPPKAIGGYSHGCLAGGKALATDGPAWQAMRLSRNRNWGHPKLISLVEKFAKDAQKLDDWPGLLVGDISQPRGGPMLTGHASHQVGLDADIWLTPMPNKTLTRKEREDLNATSMLDSTDIAVDPKLFTDKHVKLIKRAASYPEVERILVHPAIKKALCVAAGSDRGWLGKVRPMQGHYYHFHMRIGCPPGSTNCEPQKATTGDDGCGKEVEEWIARVTPYKGPPIPKPPGWKPAPPKPPLSMAQLPSECTAVLESGPSGVPVPAEAKADVRTTIKAPAALKPHLRKLRAAQKN